MSGFGNNSFGQNPFGNVDWARIVLWDELPEYVKNEDLDAGGWYYKFVTALLPTFNQLRYLIYRSHQHVLDPRTARADLLGYIARNFGIVPDLAEPEDYQRTKIEIVGRWRLIKGTTEAYEVLCAIHGFYVNVYDLWWNGNSYVTSKPLVQGEVSGEMGGDSSLDIRLLCYPVTPGSVIITINDGINDKTITDDGDGNLSGDASGTVDYSFGFIDGIIDSPLPLEDTEIESTYDSIEGGCASLCGGCVTHYLRLDITPGSISGSDSFTLSDAWARLFEKINRDIKPIHVDLLSDVFEEEFLLNIGYRFDNIESDADIVDESGFRPIADDESW